jgi:predicted unusual protein kinase regulating ubiquinone biosynthesis (AarF/ABC1/UbiB family)
MRAQEPAAGTIAPVAEPSGVATARAAGSGSGLGGSSLRATGLPQLVRLAWLALRNAVDAGWGALGDLFASPAARAERRASRQARRVRALVATLGALKGAFAKAGQFGALRYDAVPRDLREGFATLQDRVPPLRFDAVRAVVEAELGAPLASHFARFEPEPLGAASIAQAHRAWLADGRAVVVKVQYPWLAASLGADLAILRAGLWLATLRRRRGGADRARLFDEFAACLREELDFAREAAVAREIAANLASDDRVVVPAVIDPLTTRRVLTMSHHPAVRITDRDALRRLGVDPREVLEILARAYAKQVFVDGLFHADPHPGNLFVVDEPEARTRPRVLFVDFGLSKRLAPDLRRELRLAIFALLRADLEGFLAGMERLQMIAPGSREGVAAAVASMFERIRAEGAAPLALAGDRVLALKDEAKRLLEETPGLQLPNDLLLYAKTVSHLFGLGREIAPEVDLMKLSVPYLLRFLATPEA